MELNNPLGVITLLWSENFCEKDLWVFEKIREMGFTSVDIAVGDPDIFPKKQAAAVIRRTGLLPVVTKALPAAYNPISPDPHHCRGSGSADRSGRDLCWMGVSDRTSQNTG